jgi:hypothetical protein
MIVRCTNCDSAFAVDDVKVNNKKFAFTCPKCDYENVIDNRMEVKSSLAGPAIVDEAMRDTGDEMSSGTGLREEALVGGGKDDFFEERPQAKGPDRPGSRDIGIDDNLLGESSAVDSDDLSDTGTSKFRHWNADSDADIDQIDYDSSDSSF